MSEVDLISELISDAGSISYSNKEDFDLLEGRTKMVIRKLFGNDSHYFDDLDRIKYSPMAISLGGSDDQFRMPFERGLDKFRNVLTVMREDIQLRSNYESENLNAAPIKSLPKIQTLRLIRVLIASPADVTTARDLLLHRLETKFRRESFEDRCSARIAVDGWETLASQTGYPQDIVNEQLLSKADIIIAVFRHKLGTPTIDVNNNIERAPSGTAEELLYAIKNVGSEKNPLGMAYFYSQAPMISLDSTHFEEVKDEWERLKDFKDSIENRILFKSYNVEEELLDLVCHDLCNNINNYFGKEQ